MTDDRGNYFREVLKQTAAIAFQTEDIERVKKHLERHGINDPSNRAQKNTGRDKRDGADGPQ